MWITNLVVNCEIVVTHGCIENGEERLEEAFKILQGKHEVNIAYQSEHENEQSIKEEEVKEVDHHFPQNLHKGTNALRVLKHRSDSEYQAGNRNRKQVLKLEVDVVSKVCEYSLLKFYVR